MSVLRDRRFRRMLAAEGVSTFGDSALFLSLGIWGKDLTGSNSVAGSILAALAAPSLVGPLLGHLVDRVPRRRLLIATNLLTALAMLPLLAVHSAGQVWVLYLVALCYGLSFRITGPASAGLLKDMLPSADAAGARAAIMTVDQGLRVLSPAVGAGIYTVLGGPLLAVFDIATFVVAVLLLFTVRVVESTPERVERQPFWREVTGGFRHLRATPLLVQLVGMLSATVAAAGLADSALYGAVGHIGRPAAFVGVLLSVQGGGSAVGGMIAARLGRRLGEARTAGLALALIAAGMLAWLVPSVPTFLLAALVEGIGIPIAFVALGTATQLYTPARLQGRVSAATNLLITGPQTAFIVLGAGLIAVVDYRLLFAVIAVVSAGCCLPLLLRPAAPPPVVPSVADPDAPILVSP